MVVYTIAYKSKCAGGGHYHFNIKRGTTVLKQITISPQDLEVVDVDVMEMAKMLIKIAIKQAAPTTLAQAKTAIENISVTI